ncbi:hypothetical protein A9Q84_10720 [Halobacteriovorax marinus]|uniref:Uncharacterized protein n=1 Tax=Halobacteriovorax marinus TaxID=97084 RepID=A0A1Y5F7T8_9BACT|nr:hypothetical protein A9Q84_10720 [Halobacteriovorax marinus]
MKKVIELNLKLDEMYEEFYPKLKEQVFHYTSGSNLDSILNEGFIHPIKENVRRTSAHSHESMGRFLNAVCLFDLRFESFDNIEKIRDWYNFLSRRFEDKTLVYLVVSPLHYKDITTLSMVKDEAKEKAMYLPHIESWHVKPLPLSKLQTIYKVNIIE